MINYYLSCLIEYSLRKGLVVEEDKVYIINQFVDLLQLDGFTYEEPDKLLPIHEILDKICDYACEKGIIEQDTVTRRDLFDTKVMGIITPKPSGVIREFRASYECSPIEATNRFYAFCQDVNYIRKERIQKDKRWKTSTEYGELDITINLSKPEKDPKDIAAAAADVGKSKYPSCLLCVENEGFAGNMRHPARQNLRLIPVIINGEKWGLQYSPYSYYPEHCIVLNSQHKPMVIDDKVFGKLLDFVEMFPHYFVGSNADLPIVGGSILSHEHFQGGRYEFAMDKAQSVYDFTVPGYSNVSCSVLKWPLSVIRLTSRSQKRIEDLSNRILERWRMYNDAEDNIVCKDQSGLHNTITPIAKKVGTDYRMDLVLRNNQVSNERPTGLHHPRQEYHHIKKENIGLIEVMGLAVLPSRLDKELARLKEIVLAKGDLRADSQTISHADWAEEFLSRNRYTEDTLEELIQDEVGTVFMKVLEDCGVFSDMDSFKRFIEFVCKTKKEIKAH